MERETNVSKVIHDYAMRFPITVRLITNDTPESQNIPLESNRKSGQQNRYTTDNHTCTKRPSRLPENSTDYGPNLIEWEEHGSVEHHTYHK